MSDTVMSTGTACVGHVDQTLHLQIYLRKAVWGNTGVADVGHVDKALHLCDGVSEISGMV
jgi:hypothetical protein